jgi:hypothetical protein
MRLTLASVARVEMVLYIIGRTPRTARGTPIYVIISGAEAIFQNYGWRYMDGG